MLVQIDKFHLEFGMFVEAVACPHREFQKKRFILKTQVDLAAILVSSAQHVLINTTLGHAHTADRAGDAKRVAAVKQCVDQSADELSATLRNFVRDQSLDIDRLGGISLALGKAVEEAPDVLLKVTRLKSKDTVTYLHSVGVSALMMRVAQIMDLPDDTIRELGMAGLLHDVGKLLIEDAVLKKQGALAAEEKAVIRTHPQIGYDLLKSAENVTQLMLDVCLWHHEVLDGSGYPNGMKSARLPMSCKIAAVCDVFEALTSARPYKAPWPAGRALKWLYERPELYDYRIVGRLHEGIIPRASHSS